MASKRTRPSTIEELIDAEAWTEARRRIRTELRKSPTSHWLLSRLALTYYEQRNYQRALETEQRALDLAPRCPLCLWGLAGAHDMLGHRAKAEALYTRLIRRGVKRIAHGECGEGVPSARGLVADCWYRLGVIRQSRRDVGGAITAFQHHLERRQRGTSIYSASEVRENLRALTARQAAAQRR